MAQYGFHPIPTYDDAMVMRQRAQERETKRQREMQAAQQLSHATANEYAEDVLDAMIDTEVNLPSVDPQYMMTD